MMENSSEGSAWFWRIFGGTVLGAVVILLATVLNYISQNITALRSDLTSTVQHQGQEITSLKERLSAFDELKAAGQEKTKTFEGLLEKFAAAEAAREIQKEKIAALEEQLKTLQEKAATLEANRETNKEKITTLEARIETSTQETQALKERITVLEEKIKKPSSPNGEEGL